MNSQPITVTEATTIAPQTADPILREGDTGTPVRTLQTLLNQQGANLVVDGKFGTATKVAVIQFQQQRGLVSDGIVGPKTWAALRQQSEPISLINVCRHYSPGRFPHQTRAIDWLQGQIPYRLFREFYQRWENTSISPDMPVRAGHVGAAVYELQTLLNRRGANLITDGRFGSATTAAVQAFQRQNGLVADGIVGELTWARLRQLVEPRFLRNFWRAYEPERKPFQTDALGWLQKQIPLTTLSDFARRWRNQA